MGRARRGASGARQAAGPPRVPQGGRRSPGNRPSAATLPQAEPLPRSAGPAPRRTWPSMGTADGMRQLMRCGSRLRPARLATKSTNKMRAWGVKCVLKGEDEISEGVGAGCTPRGVKGVSGRGAWERKGSNKFWPSGGRLGLCRRLRASAWFAHEGVRVAAVGAFARRAHARARAAEGAARQQNRPRGWRRGRAVPCARATAP